MARPTSRGWPPPPSTTGTTRASHARSRRSAGVIAPPKSSAVATASKVGASSVPLTRLPPPRGLRDMCSSLGCSGSRSSGTAPSWSSAATRSRAKHASSRGAYRVTCSARACSAPSSSCGVRRPAAVEPSASAIVSTWRSPISPAVKAAAVAGSRDRRTPPRGPARRSARSTAARAAVWSAHTHAVRRSERPAPPSRPRRAIPPPRHREFGWRSLPDRLA